MTIPNNENLNASLDAIAEKAPDIHSVHALQLEAMRLEGIHKEALRKLYTAAAERARIFGWVPTAKELGISPKMLHAWAKDIPGDDYSEDYKRLERYRARKQRREDARA